MSNKTNHPKKYVRWDDWESWKLKEWFPFRIKVKLLFIEVSFILAFVALILALLAILSIKLI